MWPTPTLQQTTILVGSVGGRASALDMFGRNGARGAAECSCLQISQKFSARYVSSVRTETRLSLPCCPGAPGQHAKLRQAWRRSQRRSALDRTNGLLEAAEFRGAQKPFAIPYDMIGAASELPGLLPNGSFSLLHDAIRSDRVSNTMPPWTSATLSRRAAHAWRSAPWSTGTPQGRTGSSRRALLANCACQRL